MSSSNNNAASNAVIDVSIGGGNTVDASGALYVGNMLNATFIGPGTLIISEQQPTTGGLTLDGFQNLDTTEVSQFSGWSSYSVAVGTPAGGTTTDTITFTGMPYTLTFTHVPVGITITASQSNGNTDIVATACFLSGTGIATPDGTRPVETLAAGDRVLTRAGVSRRIVWTGRRRVRSGARHPASAWPVRITAGAVAPGVPRRDLLVTPEHAVLVDGHLLPARLLVNGATIRSEALDRYTFHHIELETHDLLLAEGMGAESYLDTGNRALFAGDNVVGLRGRAEASGAAIYRARGCRPLTLDPVVTGAVWRRLAARAAALGHPVRLAPCGDSPALRIEADGRRIRPVHADATQAVFALPAGLTRVTIASRATMPWTVTPWIDDRRRLGVAIRRIEVRAGDGVQVVPLDSPRLGAGWWAAEGPADRPVRWTDGAAHLCLPPSAAPVTLHLALAASGRHPADQADTHAAPPLTAAG